ncbi:MAG TPA: hypothetical protein VFU30_13790 [Gaiellaceae bacterium]|nr:hypothetical protein [Gaiellaceae bacterium]
MHLHQRQLKFGAFAVFAVCAVLAGAAAAAAGATAAGATERVSVSSTGVQGNDISGRTGPPAISADGNVVAFDSIATNLVAAGTTSGQDNIYLRDRSNGATDLVSVTPTGAEPDGSSFLPDLSGDGRYVAFQSVADDLVPGDGNGFEDVFVYDRAAGTTTRASVAGKSKDANDNSLGASISDDGRYVAFRSDATNLVKGARPTSIYVRDLVKHKTELASVASDGTPANSFNFNADISGDGRYVAFDSQATNLAPGDDGTTQIFVHDRVTGTTTQASVDGSGTPANGESTDPSISADGRYVAFDSDASNLVPGDTNGVRDVFVHDLLTGQTTRVDVDSAGNQANEISDISIRGGGTFGPAISGDGRYVAFDSAAGNLVPEDTNTCTLANPQPVFDFPITGQCPDVFVHDLQTGATTRASLDSNGNQADGPSTDPAINGDGSAIAFFSVATNLVPDDTNTCGVFPNPGQCPDIFVHTP